MAYRLSKYLSGILKAFQYNISSNIKNAHDLKNKLMNMTIGENEIMASYDVISLFTSIPICECLDIVRTAINNNQDIISECPLSTGNIIKSLKHCLESTYFTFRDRMYRQSDGFAMGSPVSPIVATLYMKALEERALRSVHCQPRIWYRFVDDTFVVVKKANQ
ncbi:unnamed protein product [Heterobilharzia americana]|nr:unnamed protein product [Heterobilharzia americana]